MFSSFSWTNYFLFIGAVLVVYALIILALYYRKEMNKMFFLKRDALQEMIDRPVAEVADPMRMVHELVAELGKFIRKAADLNTSNGGLVNAMKLVICDFLILRPTEFKSRINQYIKDEMEINGLMPLTMEQWKKIWGEEEVGE